MRNTPITTSEQSSVHKGFIIGQHCLLQAAVESTTGESAKRNQCGEESPFSASSSMRIQHGYLKMLWACANHLRACNC